MKFLYFYKINWGHLLKSVNKSKIFFSNSNKTFSNTHEIAVSLSTSPLLFKKVEIKINYFEIFKF